MRLILVRHGETTWNAEHRIQGQRDCPLTPRGYEQIKKVAEFLKDEKIDVAYSSDLQRAVTTAEEILKYHPNCKLIKDRELREMSYGALEGMTIPDTEEFKPGIWEKRSKDRWNFLCPGGENYLIMFKNRIAPFLKHVLNLDEYNDILVVAHRGPLRVIIGKMAKATEHEISDIKFNHNCVYFVEYNNNKVESMKYYLVGENKKGNGFALQSKTEW